MRTSDLIGRKSIALALMTMGIGFLGGCGGSETSTGKSVPDNTVEQQATQKSMEEFYATKAKKK